MNALRILITSLFISLALQSNAQVTLEKIWASYSYLPNTVAGFEFMNDGKHYTKLNNNDIVSYDITTGEAVDLIFSSREMTASEGFNGRISDYAFSADENLLIIESNREAIYRRSSKANFFIYDRSESMLIPVRKDAKVMYASLSPDGQKIAYVYENNIYYYDLNSGKTIAVTKDGKKNEIINGASDWVYEEELYLTKSFFWSPDSKKIAFMRYDESEVKEFTLTNYRDGLYPEYVTYKYPKVGEKNSEVSLGIFRLDDHETQWIDMNDQESHYIPRIKWTKDPDILFIYHLNRHQNNLKLYSLNTLNNEKDLVIDEQNKYYISITDDIRFLDDRKHFIWTSESSGHNHIYLYKLNGELVRPLTKGDHDITAFYGVDEKRSRVYYQAAEKGAFDRQVFAVDLEGKNKELIMGHDGTNDIQFSSTFDFFVNTHSTINQPETYRVYDSEGTMLRSLEENEDLKKIMAGSNVQEVEFFNFTTTENVDLNGYMIKPANMQDHMKYPLLMYVYGGPRSQKAVNEWQGQNYWWFQMLSQMGYVVACVDNRGTAARGEEFKKMTYLNLGHYETIDQIEAAKYLAGFEFIDEKRIGIFGWSYGGYMSSLCILKGNDIFKTAIAVAPVINWKWYDSIYTERYMRTLEENPEGYALNAPINFVDRLKGNYLLVHGMGDDNVHFQHTAEMAKALIAANKQFDTYFYPNDKHGINGANSRLHLYKKMTDFLNENL